MTVGTDESWIPRAAKVWHAGTGQWITRPVRYHSDAALAWKAGGLKLSTLTESPTVATLPASALRSAFGVNVHLSWQWTAYSNTQANQDAVVSLMTELGVGLYRERFFPTDPQQKAMIPRLAAAGMKHYAIIGNYSSTATDVQADVDALLAAYTDPSSVVGVIAGINEPDSAGVDWIPHTVELQQALYQRVRSYSALSSIPVGSPVLHGVATTDVTNLGNAGANAASDWVTLHHYPGTGSDFASGLDAKLAAAQAGYPNKPVSVDEYGYVSPDPNITGNLPPEWVYGVYGPRALVEAVSRGISAVLIYELLDQSDRPTEWSGHFGMVNTDTLSDPNGWRKKEVFDPMARLISLTRDDGPAFTPEPLQATITGTPKTLALSKRTGEHSLLHWRNEQVYSGSTKQQIVVPPVNQTVTFPTARTVTLTDVTSGTVTALGSVRSYTVAVGANVIHAAIGSTGAVPYIRVNAVSKTVGSAQLAAAASGTVDAVSTVTGSTVGPSSGLGASPLGTAPLGS